MPAGMMSKKERKRDGEGRKMESRKKRDCGDDDDDDDDKRYKTHFNGVFLIIHYLSIF